MERERLTRLMTEPDSMVREDLAGLEALARQYPWFSGARLLHAAGERLSGRVMAEETLRAAAAHLPSRAALFDLANRVANPRQTPLRVVRDIPAPIGVSGRTTQELEPVNGGADAALIGRTNQEEAAVAPALRGEPEAVRTSALVERTEATAIEMPPASIESASAPPSASEPPVQALENALAEEYVKTALTQAYDLTWQDRLPEPVEQASTIKVKPVLTHDARLRFSEWLTASDKPFEGSTRAASNTPHSLSAATVDTKGLDAKALIDRFIRQQPPEIPPKPAFFTPQQAARKSLDDRTGIVTETLARIYAEQGNIPKAREAYQRLALKYPDKSAYFAALSQALEDQQNP